MFKTNRFDNIGSVTERRHNVSHVCSLKHYIDLLNIWLFALRFVKIQTFGNLKILIVNPISNLVVWYS